MMRPVRLLVALVVSVLVLSGCNGSADSTGTPAPGAISTTSPSGDLSVAPASFDLSVGEDERFLTGVFTNDRQLLVGGQVELAFYYLGEEPAASDEAEPVDSATASFLPVPGTGTPEDLDGPRLAEEPTVTGVYETTMSFDRPGYWGVQVTADLEGEQQRGTGVFEVAEEGQVVGVGDRAPASSNVTVDDDVSPRVVDSRAQDGSMDDVPDPQLHDSTVAEAIEAGRPVVVAITTPVYCVSQFCGPITDAIEELEREYGDRAEFVHVEVWQDFEAQELAPAAAEWIQTGQGGNEPWVFLVGPDGTVTHRWDNVLDLDELTAALEELPA